MNNQPQQFKEQTMSEEKSKNKGGRPKLELDEETIEKLAELHCNLKEIAFVMGCHKDTIKNNYQHIVDRGMAKGRMKLRRAMFRNAVEKDHAVMQIFLAKNLLGMADVPQNTEDSVVLPWEDDDAK